MDDKLSAKHILNIINKDTPVLIRSAFQEMKLFLTRTGSTYNKHS